MFLLENEVQNKFKWSNTSLAQYPIALVAILFRLAANQAVKATCPSVGNSGVSCFGYLLWQGKYQVVLSGDQECQVGGFTPCFPLFFSCLMAPRFYYLVMACKLHVLNDFYLVVRFLVCFNYSKFDCIACCINLDHVTLNQALE